MEERSKKELFSSFRSEFLNRIDEIITFAPLEKESIIQIADIMLSDLKKRVMALGIELSFSDRAIEKLLREGYDSFFGARPLRRAITKLFENRFSEELLNGRFKNGDCVTADTSDDGDIVFLKSNK